jgi:glycosyltransferase involved in cell wall biosynthesis
MTSPGTVHILGTHGVPAAYGGFETAAENVGLHLAAKGWPVVVYCQLPGSGRTTTDQWKGIERVLIHEKRDGWLGTASFDRRSIAHMLRRREPGDVCLTFGYNTGVFNVAQRTLGVPNVINMDGMEWTRRRWGVAKQAILLANERFAGAVGTVLIGDHPEITRYLQRHFGRSRVTTIGYGAYPMSGAPDSPVRRLGLTPGHYATMICRPIPENSVLEIVTAWTARRRGIPLVALGSFDPADPYHARVLEAAGDEVVFPGAIYEPEAVSALRFHGRLYLHGHTVGGTNPSLVEAMAAGNAVIAQNNAFNRYVAGEGNRYFDGVDDLAETLDTLVDDVEVLERMGDSSRERHLAHYTWDRIGDLYERALLRALAHGRTSR